METIDDLLRRIIREEVRSALSARQPLGPGEAAAPDPRRLYSVATVAELMEMSTDWVYARINAQELAVVELGSTRTKQRISAGELERFISERTFGGANR